MARCYFCRQLMKKNKGKIAKSKNTLMPNTFVSDWGIKEIITKIDKAISYLENR